MDEHLVKSQKEKSLNKKILRIIFATLVICALLFLSTLFYLIGKRQESQKTKSSLEYFKSSYEVVLSPTPTQTQKVSSTPAKKVSSTPTPKIKTKIIPSSAHLDGFVSSNQEGGSSALEIRAGRNKFLVSRGFVSFDLSELPADAFIAEATLKLYLIETSGSLSQLGKLQVDHLTYGDILDNKDYSLPALLTSFSDIQIDSKPGWKEADVSEAVKNDLENARSTTQFRIHFEKETTGGNESGDFVYFESSDNTKKTDNFPQLIIKYY